MNFAPNHETWNNTPLGVLQYYFIHSYIPDDILMKKGGLGETGRRRRVGKKRVNVATDYRVAI